MGLMDSLLGAASQALAGQAGQQQAGGLDLMGLAAGLLNQHGGLPGLLQQLQSSGLMEQVQSWVSTGANLPVSGEQITAALGSDSVAQMAQQTGLSHGELGAQLAQYLPQIIDHLTPNGQVPAAGSAGGVDLGSLAGMLGGLLKQG